MELFPSLLFDQVPVDVANDEDQEKEKCEKHDKGNTDNGDLLVSLKFTAFKTNGF